MTKDFRVAGTIVALCLCLVGSGWDAAAGDGSVVTAPSALTTASNPDFDAVAFQPLVCPVAGDPQGDENPDAVDLVGDATHAPTYYAWDSSYLYFRFRVTGDPSGAKGFAQYSWVILLQVPSGDPFQHQFEVSLNGVGADDDFGNSGGQKGDTIEVWKNDPAENISFTPLFHDTSELRLFAQRHDFASPATANTTPIARIALAADGSNFGGDPDYFVDFAFPMSVLIAKGVVTGVSQIAESLYFPATSADSSQYNKDHLACRFLPYTNLTITKGVVPTVVPANVTTGVVHTITVRNDGGATAKGLVIGDTAFPAALSGVTVEVSSDDATVSWAVVTTNPLLVKVPRLPQGKTVTVRIESNANFSCQTPSFTNTATASATNAEEVTASATLGPTVGGAEICDGIDNNCNGQVDEGATLCSDGNACTQTDTCQAGVCSGANPVVCTASDQCHVAGTCDPSTGTCSDPNKANGSGCNDGNACTQSDSCQSGTCTGSNPVVCAASDQCHSAGVCDPSSGSCSNPNKSDGAGCDDGDACTQTDTCVSGVCTGVNRVTCTASDPCHVAGTCNPSTGTCSNPTDADGSTCDDGDACTQADTCQAGVCTGANPVVCAASDQCHVAGTCDPSTGACSDPNKANGSGCSDGDACTQTDTCQAGICIGANPVVCTATDQCHVAGVCDPSSGSCSNPMRSNGAGCDDGDACTQTDTCESGVCSGANPVVCNASDQCHVAGTCNPASGACSNPYVTSGSDCDDGNACTQTDTCQSGVCTGANPVVCTASDPCHVAGTCDPSTGSCSNPNKSNGSSCSDGNACTQTDTCQSGTCTGANAVACTASDQCHIAGVCDPSSGSCSNPTRSDGAGCDDGNACTQTDTCESGACTGVNPVACTASDQCHVAGTCDPSSGTCSNPSKSNGSSCNDDNACTETDTCQSGACIGANPVGCTASDQCHVAGTCDPATGTCSSPNKANGASCNDGNACTQTDTCQSGTCTGTNAVVCTASDQCHVAGVCDPSSGSCSNPHRSDGAGCDDGDACTQTDTCESGVCVGVNVVVCTARDQCHDVGVCYPSSGTCSNPSKSNGSSCNDGNGCTQSDTCQAGTCTGANPVVCTASDQCHVAGTCNPDSGTCSNPNKGNGASCNDGNACTQSDTCQSGTCTGANPVVCTASDQCHVVGTCNPTSGACSNPYKSNGSSCNDGNACTQTDTCQSGGCVGASPVVCTALDACHTAGTCDPTSGACSSPNRSDGFGCNDGNACTQNDHCESGACAGTTVDCDDHNLCTNDSCNTATGCTHANNTRACDDGNACTTNDACAAGSCAGGPALGCNDQNGCTNDSCNPATGCVHANNTVACNDGFACTTADACSGGVCVGGPPLTPDCKEPKSMGFYKRLCMGPHPEDELTQANVDCVNDWSTFATVTSIAGACRALNPDPSNDKCQQAAAQFMAALLNLCKGRLQMGEPIVSTCSNHLTVGNSLNDANAILTNPGRTDAACVGAQCETEELNSGRAVGAASLLANRIGGTIRVSWQQPPTGPGWSAPASYSVWRRPRGVGAFAVIATATGLSFDDLQSIPGTDFEYQVTVNW